MTLWYYPLFHIYKDMEKIRENREKKSEKGKLFD